MKQRIPLVILALLSLAACGRAGDLSPATGQALPQPAYGQEERQSAPSLITASSQARPGRSDELLRRSVRREADPFDLPPGSDTNAEYKAYGESAPKDNSAAQDVQTEPGDNSAK